ncbi:MAG: hypothetical protein ACPGWR_09125 [Ardenticatenaceae bacterium]
MEERRTKSEELRIAARQYSLSRRIDCGMEERRTKNFGTREVYRHTKVDLPRYYESKQLS